MGGDLSGVKSWFLFDDEIICAGAGVDAADINDESRIITVVDNIPVVKDTNLALSNPGNGYRNVLSASKSGGVWEPLVDTVTKGVHGQRNWICASAWPGSTRRLDWSYIFGDGKEGSHLSSSNVYYRLNTKAQDVARLAEIFIAPEEGSYQYTMVAGKATDSYNNSSLYQTDARVVLNTVAIQAAADAAEGIVSVNKWDDERSMVDNQVVSLDLNGSMALGLKKDFSTGNLTVTVAKPSDRREGFLEITMETAGKGILSNSNPDALKESSFGSRIYLRLDASSMSTESVTLEIEGAPVETVTGERITMVRGKQGRIEKPDTLSGDVDWKVKIPKPTGGFVRNAGSNKIKRELKEGEVDGNRTAGDADGSHIASARDLPDGNVLLTANEKGSAVVVATDESGRQQQWLVTVLYEEPDNLPHVKPEDFEEIRKRWKESLIGADLTVLEGGMEILEAMNQETETVWEGYAYKGQDSCRGIPWPEDEGAVGNKDISYEDDAVEFRPAFKRVLTMAKSYAAKGSRHYQNQELLKDMKEILFWLCTNCYTPKTQTDNWWTWEIGMPKDLLPILILLGDSLTEDEIALYTEALYFFQPDPYHEGVIGTGSTHAQGYRESQGANIIDCSKTALGLGILRKDNELVYLAQKASAETFVIQTVEDSTKIPNQGYHSGFYADGSYLDHAHVPYLGAYGIEFLKGGAGMPPLFAGTPWEYPREVQKNLEFYLKEGVLNGMYDGLMLDCLKGSSVSRPNASNRAAGREAMILILGLMNSVSPEVREELKGALKVWMETDPGFIKSLSAAESMDAKAKALEILEDESVSGRIKPIHKNLPLMDRAIHRTDRFLAAISMYSERIQNTEIMNHENRYGWHQGSGMTYLYNGDREQYTDNFWNTVNPLRLAGTTIVSKNIGNGRPDSSGFAQGGDFRSREAWVGGSSIGLDGINGMSLTGEVRLKDGESSPAVPYSPGFSAKKSWFMFDNQILCMGAGITNFGEMYPVETIVENRRLKTEADNILTVNGNVQKLRLETARLEDIVDGRQDVSGVKIPNVLWAHLEGNTVGSDIGYYFPSASQTLSVRKGRNIGDWSLVGSSNEEGEENYMEMWFDHGVNPQADTYGYVLLPDMDAGEVERYSKEPGITILSNTPKLQAAFGREGKLFGANVWTGDKTVIGDFTIRGASSVMAKENEDGVLTVAVSDPTMKNTGFVTVKIKRPISHIVSADENMEVKQTKDGVILKVRTKDTLGASSYASLQLAYSISPQAVTMVPGQQCTFAVSDFIGAGVAVSWKVSAQFPLESGTGIGMDGELAIDSSEKNKSLTVSAWLDNETVLQAFVSLGGEMVPVLPESVEKLREMIELVLEELEYGGDLGDDKIQNAVKAAVAALENMPNEELSVSGMGEVLALEELYIRAMAAKDIQIGSRVDVSETLDVKIGIEGAALSIPLRGNGDVASPFHA